MVMPKRKPAERYAGQEDMIRAKFRYQKTTGKILYRVDVMVGTPGRKYYSAGDEAGRKRRCGYLLISMGDTTIDAHILAWFLATGEWPAEQVDHRNRKRSDNRWRNLRLATQSQQNFNNSLRSDSRSGHKGVSWCKAHERWCVRIRVHGKKVFTGYYRRKKDAIAARRVQAKKAHGEFYSMGLKR